MRVYQVSRNDFYSEGVESLASHFSEILAACQGSMRQLMDRYGIRGKRVLSIASGPCFEEYHLAQHNEVTAVDIDLTGRIECHLKTLPTGEGFTYVIGDAFKYTTPVPFDVLYMSSFVPDEMYRRHKASRGLLDPRVPRKLAQILGRTYSAWNPNWPPFHKGVEGLLHNVKGLMIVQSYASGLDASDSGFVQALHDWFEERGFHLEAVYAQHLTPNLYLIVARNSEETPSDAPPISMLSGRHQFVRSVFPG